MSDYCDGNGLCVKRLAPRTPDTTAKVDVEAVVNRGKILAKMLRTRKEWATQVSPIHGDSIAADFERAAEYVESAGTTIINIATLTHPSPRGDAEALVLAYHKFADAVEHDLAVPLYLRGMAGVAKTKAEQWLEKQGA